MIRVYCDRCRKQCKDETLNDNAYGEAQKTELGCYISRIVKVTEGKYDEKHDYKPIDLCDKCKKELEEIVFNFMNSK